MAARTTSAGSRSASRATSTAGSSSIQAAPADTGRSACPAVIVPCRSAADAGPDQTLDLGIRAGSLHTWDVHHSLIHTHDADAATARDAGVAGVRAFRCAWRENDVEEQLFTRDWTCCDG